MAKKSEGWLRRKMYADGETWLYCYYTTRPEDGKRVEHSQRVGLVRRLSDRHQGVGRM